MSNIVVFNPSYFALLLRSSNATPLPLVLSTNASVTDSAISILPADITVEKDLSFAQVFRKFMDFISIDIQFIDLKKIISVKKQ